MKTIYTITKMTKLKEINNEMCHNYYYLINGRIYNDDKSRFKKFKFVYWFDIFDVMEYLDKDRITKKDFRDFLNGTAWTCVDGYINDYNNLDGLYNFCNNTIEQYNN